MQIVPFPRIYGVLVCGQPNVGFITEDVAELEGLLNCLTSEAISSCVASTNSSAVGRDPRRVQYQKFQLANRGSILTTLLKRRPNQIALGFKVLKFNASKKMKITRIEC